MKKLIFILLSLLSLPILADGTVRITITEDPTTNAGWPSGYVLKGYIIQATETDSNGQAVVGDPYYFIDSDETKTQINIVLPSTYYKISAGYMCGLSSTTTAITCGWMETFLGFVPNDNPSAPPLDFTAAPLGVQEADWSSWCAQQLQCQML